MIKKKENKKKDRGKSNVWHGIQEARTHCAYVNG